MNKYRVEPKGLGDSLKNLTYITGVSSAVKKITKAVGIKDCGCEARKEFLNKLVPYEKKE